jgi:UDP-N-acetyl-D-mannosaminuronic acid dehydrogenase
VDPWFFVEKAPGEAQLIRQARLVNDNQPDFVLQLLQEEFGSLQGKTFAVLGVTYKPDVDDVRESPALRVINLLEKAGAGVRAFDPYMNFPHKEMEFLVESSKDAFMGADGILILVDHMHFKPLHPEATGNLLSNKFILDTRNTLERDAWQNAGFIVKLLGDGRD